jgi:hypothetical protein
MGDGWIDRQKGQQPRLGSAMITEEYLQYVDNVFSVIGHDVSLKQTAEENAKHKRESGFRPNADPKNYSDIYIWRTMSHPDFQDFADWYSSGEKVWPDGIQLTPTVLKHWYCGDGSWNNNASHNCIRIGMSNEREYIDKVDQFFHQAGLPLPSNYNIYKTKSGRYDCSVVFSVDQSKELWEYMGEPLPGFEYKWPEEYR